LMSPSYYILSLYWDSMSSSFDLNLIKFEHIEFNQYPSTAFGHSDRKKRALTGRHNFVTSIL
jgi:hypothetical protein